MGSPLDEVFAKTAEVLDWTFGEPVTLRRRTYVTTDVNASWSKRVGSAQQVETTNTTITDLVWLIRTEDYRFDGVAVEPHAGDVIEQYGGLRWELMPSEGKRAYDPDPDGTHWILRTKNKR